MFRTGRDAFYSVHSAARQLPSELSIIRAAARGVVSEKGPSMSMKLVKKTAEYSIYQRGDERYAVKNAARQPSR